MIWLSRVKMGIVLNLRQKTSKNWYAFHIQLYIYIMIMISVFVVAKGMNVMEKVKDSHKHWKMKIVSMHQDEGMIWIVDNWFYFPTNLELHARGWCI